MTVMILPVLEIDSSSIEILLAVENPKVTSVFPPVTKVFPVNVIEAEVCAPVVIDEIVALVNPSEIISPDVNVPLTSPDSSTTVVVFA